MLRSFTPVLALLLATLALAASPASAQTSAGVTGRVLDAATGEGIPTATVALYRGDDFVTGATSALDGTYTIRNLTPGPYSVRFSFVGYATQTRDDVALSAGQTLDLGTVRLAAEALALEAAEVVAERPAVEQRADRTVYNVADQPVTAGGSALEALETLPSLEVDADGGVSLRGSQNVAIYVNGRPVPVSGTLLASFLRGIPSDQIERVEVIPNPSARFEPDGMSGIVNIVLRQTPARGVSGGLTLGADTAPGGELGANLNVRQGPWDGAFSYGFRANTRQPFDTQDQRSLLPGGLAFEQEARGDQRNTNHRLNASVNRALRPGTTLSLDGSLGYRDDSRNNAATTLLFPGTLDAETRLRTTDGAREGLNLDAALGLRHRFDEAGEHELSGEVRATRNTGTDTFLFTDLDGPGLTTAGQERSRNDDRTDEAYAQLDYNRTFGDTRIETGGKLTTSRLQSDVTFERAAGGGFAVVPGRTSAFGFDEAIGAAYVQGARPFGPIEAQVGLRAETARRSFDLSGVQDDFRNTYASLFPSAFAVYTLAPGTLAKAGYSRRINRPRTRQLNPFPSFEDTLNVRIGNPDLRPEYIDAFELTLQYRFAASVTPFYRRTTDVIRRRFFVDEATGVSTFSFQNLDTQNSYGVDLTFTPLLGPRLRGFVSGSLFRTVTDGESVQAGLANDALTWNVRANVTAQVRPGTDLQLFGFYRGAQRVEDGRVGGFGFSTIGLRQAITPQIQLNLRVNDPLGTRQFTFERADERFQVFGVRSPNDRRITATLTYAFGQTSRRDRDDRRGENEGQNGGDEGFGF